MSVGIVHTRQCCTHDCGRPALWYPVVLVWAAGYPRSSCPVEVEVGMQFCEEHKGNLQIDDIRGLRDLVIKVCQAARKAPPDTDNMRLELRPLFLD